MKSFLIFVTYLAYANAAYNLPLTADQKAFAIKTGTECAKSQGVTQEQAFSLRDGKLDNVDGKMKCFVQCFVEKAGFFDGDQIKPAEVLAKLAPLASEVLVREAQSKCDGLKGADKCDTAYQIFECYYKFDKRINPLSF